MYGPVDPRWFEEIVSVDPVLRDPLGLDAMVRRRLQATALMKSMGVLDRLEAGAVKPPTDSTVRLFFDMLDGLAAACVAERLIFVEVSERIVLGEAGIPRASAAQAMLDLHWAGETIAGGQVNEVLEAIKRLYVAKMSKQVERMLRRWQKDGWLRAV